MNKSRPSSDRDRVAAAERYRRLQAEEVLESLYAAQADDEKARAAASAEGSAETQGVQTRLAKKASSKVPAKLASARTGKSNPRPTKAEAQPLAAEAIDRGVGAADLRGLAHQIAGHAVMALLLDVPIEQIRVGLGPDGETIGDVTRGEDWSGDFAFYPTDREGHLFSTSPGDRPPFGMIQPWLNLCPDARDAKEAEILVELAGVVAGLRFHRPEAAYQALEALAHLTLGFDPLLFEQAWDGAPPLLLAIRERATSL
jgi:hypothetical protein